MYKHKKKLMAIGQVRKTMYDAVLFLRTRHPSIHASEEQVLQISGNRGIVKEERLDGGRTAGRRPVLTWCVVPMGSARLGRSIPATRHARYFLKISFGYS